MVSVSESQPRIAQWLVRDLRGCWWAGPIAGYRKNVIIESPDLLIVARLRQEGDNVGCRGWNMTLEIFFDPEQGSKTSDESPARIVWDLLSLSMLEHTILTDWKSQSSGPLSLGRCSATWYNPSVAWVPPSYALPSHAFKSAEPDSNCAKVPWVTSMVPRLDQAGGTPADWEGRNSR